MAILSRCDVERKQFGESRRADAVCAGQRPGCRVVAARSGVSEAWQGTTCGADVTAEAPDLRLPGRRATPHLGMTSGCLPLRHEGTSEWCSSGSAVPDARHAAPLAPRGAAGHHDVVANGAGYRLELDMDAAITAL